MNKRELKQLDRELTAFLDSMTAGMGRPERRTAMRDYVTGLLLDGERKSIEPMASRLVEDNSEVQAMRQRLQQCVTVSPWSDEELMKRLALKVNAQMPGVEAWVVDDTGFPKKGTHSVGVQRQYSGTLGRTDNCQIAVSLHLAGEAGSACIGTRLYLPESWASDPGRRREAQIPEDIEFKKKWELSLEQIDSAIEWGLERRPVLADSGYGDVTEYREGLDGRQLEYVLGVESSLVVWAPGTGPIPPSPTRPKGQRGRTPTRWKTGEDKPVTLMALAMSQGRKATRTVHWREGSRGRQGTRFGAVRVRTAHRHDRGEPPGAEQWFLYEWPLDEKEPTKFWLSTLAADTSLKQLVRMAKLRWRVERDYQEMKQEVGLDHFEGRGWRGFHHHGTLCAVAHGFLALRRALFPPEQSALDVARGAPSAPAGAAPSCGLLPAVPPRR